MAQRLIDLVLSILASTLGFALSWPFWRDFEYWAESELAWYAYFVIGFILAVYVFYLFLQCLHTLFDHDRLLHEQARLASEEKERGGEL